MITPTLNVAPHGGLRVRWQFTVTDAADNLIFDTKEWTTRVHKAPLSGDEASIRDYLMSYLKTEFGTHWHEFARRYSAARGDANNSRQTRNPDFDQVGDNDVKAPDWNRPILHDQYQPPDGVWLNRVHSRVPWAPTQIRGQDGQVGTDLPTPGGARVH